jgi:hypothetical protein
MIRQYLAYVQSWQGVAYATWHASGYRDMVAHAEYMRLRAEVMRVLACIRSRKA